jgi:tetratricopeptide (TPR) repeat protein
MPLENPDLSHLIVAQGYADLGMYPDAIAELEKLAAESLDQPEVLTVRLVIHQGLKEWALMEAVAASLVHHDPTDPQWAISWAYATRRSKSIAEARPILMAAIDKHPKEALIAYNLACYECQSGDMFLAKVYLGRAMKIHPGYRRMALEDDDLQPLWEELAEAGSGD